MSYEFSYFESINHLPEDVRKAVRKLPLKRRRRMLILAELGVHITLDLVAEFAALKTEEDVDRFARTQIFK